jgi:ClpP class serine protease
MTGYNGIIARLQQAISDPGVDGILLDMDTPGEWCPGRLTVPTLSPVRDIKPIWALANDMNCSAGQLIASRHRDACDANGQNGSIGVMMAHSNYGAALKPTALR